MRISKRNMKPAPNMEEKKTTQVTGQTPHTNAVQKDKIK